MKIGIVCPYSFDAQGGVQAHIRDLTEELQRRGHTVSVLAPSESEETPDWLTATGGSVPIPFNGSVARLSFGPGSAKKTRAWLEEGAFDVVHIHEPGTPSLGMLALINTSVPVVGTFHAAIDHSRLRSLTAGIVRPLLEKISARVAVSEEARRTLVEHHSGDAVIIPNGVYTELFREATATVKWQGTTERPVIVFLGRLDERRKGLPIFAEAIPDVLEKNPGTRFLVAGRGEAGVLAPLLKKFPESIELLGEITDEEKASLLAGATAYVAPQLGGESFGIVLVEGMAAGTLVIASDIAAFKAVLDNGNAGKLFETGNPASLAATINDVIADPSGSKALAKVGQERANLYDWGTVTNQIMSVYEAVVEWGAPPVTGTPYEQLRNRVNKALG